MGVSGQWALRYKGIIGTEKKRGSDQPAVVQVQVLRNLAVSQLALTTLTLTTAHVQIITRLASAYPVWLWYLASSCKESSLFGKTFVSFMMMYGLIQAGLFASFLPPA
jgi:phosphatidylinositol glycan class V